MCCVSEKFWLRKSFEKEGEGALKFSVESFLSHSAENFGWGTTILCCVSEKFWLRKSFEKEGQGVSKVSVESFLTLSAEIFIGEQPFSAVFQKISGSEKVLDKKGEYQELPWKVFCLTVPKNFVGEQPFCAVFQRISGSESFEKEGEAVLKVSVESFLSHSSEKFGRGTILLCCVSENSGSENVLKKRGKEY